MPIISQCPVVVSMPEAALDQPAPHGRGVRRAAGSPASGSTLPSPSCCSAGSSRPPTASATWPSVFDPAVPNAVGVGQVADADGVEHDHAGSGHPGQSR